MLKPIFENIPQELKVRNQWVVWKSVTRPGQDKPTKPPFSPNGTMASSTDSRTWVDFKTAMEAAGGYDGVGFVLTEVDPYVALDFDGCRCPAFPWVVKPEVEEHLKRLNSYTEFSPSGKGFRVFVKGKIPVTGRKKGDFEIYRSARYVTLTGHRVKGLPETIEPRQQEIDTFYKQIFGENGNGQKQEEAPKQECGGSWRDLLAQAFNAKNGDTIRALYSGDTSGHPSQSEADLALCSHLAFWFAGDAAAIDAAFRESGLYRQKWDKKHGDRTYGEMTIEKAIAGAKEFYQGAGPDVGFGEVKAGAGKKGPGKKGKDRGPKVILTATLPGLVDLVNDDGVPAFLIRNDGEVGVLRSIEDQKAGTITNPPGFEHLPFELVSAAAVMQHMEDTDAGLFDEVLTNLKQYACLSDDQWLICAMYVFLTYLHDNPDIQYVAMILFYAVPERGKTRTGKAMIYHCYRGVHCVDLRETNLFRYSQDLRGTLFLDIMDVWRKAEKNQSEDVLLLRYEKGATVARVLYPEKGAFRDTRYYAVSGPTIMASNQPVHKILGTRCLVFAMPNKPGRYANPTPAAALPLKAKLTAWRARHMRDTLPDVEPVDGIEGRLWDITRPLLQICRMVAPERYDALVEAILNIATERKQERQQSDDGKLVKVLINMSPTGLSEWQLATKEITERFNIDRPADWVKTPEAVARRLKALGVKTKIIGGSSKALLTPEVLNTLSEQYGYATRENPHDPHEHNESGDNINVSSHEVHHEVEKGERSSCSTSCSQEFDFTNKSEVHEVHEDPYGVEDIVIDVRSGG